MSWNNEKGSDGIDFIHSWFYFIEIISQINDPFTKSSVKPIGPKQLKTILNEQLVRVGPITTDLRDIFFLSFSRLFYSFRFSFHFHFSFLLSLVHSLIFFPILFFSFRLVTLLFYFLMNAGVKRWQAADIRINWSSLV